MPKPVQTQAEHAIVQAELKNAIGLPDEAIQLVAVDVTRFHRLDKKLPAALVRYAVDGVDETALHQLESFLKQAIQQVPNSSYQTFPQESHADTADEARVELLERIFTENPAFYYRIAQIYSTHYLALRGTPAIQWRQLAVDPFLATILSGHRQAFVKYIDALELDEIEIDPAIKKILARFNHTQENAISVIFPMHILIGMCEVAGESPESLGRYVFTVGPASYSIDYLANVIMHMPGFVDYICQYPQILRDALNHNNLEHRSFALRSIAQFSIPIEPFIEQIIDRAVGSTKTDREIAWPLLESTEPVWAIVEKRLTNGKVDERLYAAQLLHYLDPAKAKSILTEVIASEKSEKVKAVIENLLNPTIITLSNASNDYKLPNLPEINLEVPLGEDLWKRVEELLDSDRQTFQNLLQELFQELEKQKNAIGNTVLKPSQTLQSDFDLYTNLIVEQLMQSGKRHRELASKIQQAKKQHNKAFQLCEAAIAEVMADAYWEERKERTKKALQTGNAATCRSCKIHNLYGSQQQLIQRFLDKVITQPDLALVQLLRLLIMLSYHDTKHLFYSMAGVLTQYYRLNPEISLHTLARALEKLDMVAATDFFVETLLPIKDWMSPTPFLQWEKAAIWPLFAGKIDYIERVLTGKRDHDDYRTDRIRRALQIINTFPQPPAQLVPTLWNMAFSGQPKERLMVQTTLDSLSDTRANIINHLQDSDPQKRIIAAQWLARLQETSIIPQLIAQLKTEKREAVRDAWMRSLERLGASVDQFLDRDNLIKAAETGLKKGIPNALTWFPFDRLPTLHWQDNGQVVEPQIIQWFIVQTHKQKNVEPNPMLRRYLQLMQPNDRESLGQFVLETWIAYDTKTKYSPSEAETKARQEAKLQWQSLQQYMLRQPQQTGSYQQHTEESIYKLLLGNYLNSYEGSATADKGILAIAGACCSVSAIPKIANYLKTHYGNRLAQCLALLQVLAWIEDNSAIQLLLSISNRFRTKKIQTEATNLVSQIADRHGWSRDELADRTIPTCGFTDRDHMTLDYGNRQFTAHLDDKLTLILTDPTGKTLKTLPEPRQDDDLEQAKQAKKQLSDAKKQLKQVLTLQQERLYEAMCTQRQWPFRDWEAFLAHHPIVSRHCQRLIWLELTPENQPLRTFRALGDGSLTDHTDRAITIAPTAPIVLAHGSHLTPDIRQAWQTQLDDYEIIPIFDQLTKPIYHLPSDRASDLELADFTGHMLEAFHLRGRATKLGYQRGEAQDGGWFYEYHKRFLGLGLIATIGFSGNGLPEENRPIALTQLSFSQIPDQTPSQTLEHPYHYDSRLPLGEIPIVLLSEIYSDLRSIATLGSGFDPDWEKKVWY
jgi:hypothetical protein